MARPSAIVLAALAAASALPAAAAVFKHPLDASAVSNLPRPVYDRPDLRQSHTEAERAAVAAAAAAHTLKTLPYWRGTFSIEKKTYHYSILGAAPGLGLVTSIPTVIVPIRLTVPDYSVDGSTPVVFDGSQVVQSVLGSPIFTASAYGDGTRQFGDAILRMEFPDAPASWSLTLAPSVAPVLDIVAPPGTVGVLKTSTGALVAVVNEDKVIDQALVKYLASSGYGPDTYVVFVTYNAIEGDAYGYHNAVFMADRTAEYVYSFNSWLVGLGAVFGAPSPDAATMSHEVAESIHDAFLGDLSSLTLEWGDAFNDNLCFQSYIEVADAIEDAPGPIQLYRQPVLTGATRTLYTLQNVALLPWFERQSPSKAMFGAYSFPSLTALTGPAPLTCRN